MNDADRDNFFLEDIHRLCPCRRQQITKLLELFGERDELAFPNIFIQGNTGTGKSHVVNTVMKILQLQHVLLNCIECYSTRLLYNKILESISYPNDQSFKKCDNMNDFLRYLKHLLESRNNNETFYIILDKAERLRQIDSNVFAALLRLSEFTQLNISVIYITEIVWEKFLNGFANDFFFSYCQLLISVFHLACRDLNELRHLALLNFPKYCEPLKKNDEKDVRKLWRNIEPHLRQCLLTVYLREVSDTQWEEMQQTDINITCKQKLPLELPYLSKYLVIAAFLASHNPSRTDRRFFCKSSYGKMSKRAKTAAKKGKTDEKLTGPKAFPLDRLMAIFYSIIDDDIDCSASLLIQVSTLVSLNLIAKVSADDQIDVSKYKCLVPLEFAKNIEPSQISLKFLRGEGELLNLELNEQVLTDLLELPPWLQLTKATCNRICAKIHWTSLKTDPIRLYLDCVEVEILATEEPRERASSHAPSHHATKQAKEKHVTVKATKYGFAEKVVDGMFVSINTVLVNFKASGFKASFSMSRLIIQSTSPDWQVPNNLRKTRIKDEHRGQVLIFKEIRWGTMRLDADASYIEASSHGSLPLRLITNNSIVRLTIKKHLHDCSLVSSKLEIILDDILWVLTQSQLLKLSSFVHFILKVRQKFLPLSPHSDVQQRPSTSAGGHSASNASSHTTARRSSGQYQGHGGGSNLNPLFTEHDVEETSYHLRTKRIDLHLCDDQTLDGDKHQAASKSAKQKKSLSENGGALLISIFDIRLEHYPYHIAGLRRRVNRNDEEASFCRRQWAQQLFDFFLKTEGQSLNPQHSRNASHTRRPIMHESYFVISCCSFAIMEVTTGDRQEPRPFLSSEKEALFLPADMNAIFLDFTSYYFLGQRPLPVPPSNMFLKLNPVQLTFHPLTCVWLNRFVQSVVAGFEWTKEFMTRETGPPEHLDLRIELLMPKVTIPCENNLNFPHQEQRPKGLQLQISQAVISNSRIGTVSSQSELLMDLQDTLTSKLYANDKSFPNSREDMSAIPSESWVNDYSIVHRSFASSANRPPSDVESRNILHEPRLIWCIWCEQLWLDFMGIEDSNGRPVTFVDAVPIRLWLSLPVLIPKAVQKDRANSRTSATTEMDTNRLNSPERTAPDSSVSFTNANSTISLPGALNSSHSFSVSLSSASSNSSLSVDSPVSEPRRSRHSVDGMFRSRDSRRLLVNRSSTFDDAVDNHPLRTSFSENDLLPAEHSLLHNQHADAVSLQEYDATLSIANSEPPPPYYLESPSLSTHGNPTSIGETQYGLPPAYDTITTDEQSQAPSLPSKTPLIGPDQSQHLKDLLGAKSSSVGNSKKLPTVSGLLQVTKPTSIQLDHFQLIFLIRLQEMFKDVMETIAEDTERFQQIQSPVHRSAEAGIETASFSLHLSVPSVDVNIIVPASNGVEEEQLMSLADRVKYGKIKKIFETLQSDTNLQNEQEIGSASTVPSSENDAAMSNREGQNSNEPRSSECDDSSLQSETPKDEQRKEVSQNEEARPINESPVICLTTEHETNSVHQPSDLIESAKEISEDKVIIGELPCSRADDSSGVSSTSASPITSARLADDSEEKLVYSEQNLDISQNSAAQGSCIEAKGASVVTLDMSTQTESDVNSPAECTTDDHIVSVVSLKCTDIKVSVNSEKPNSLVKVIVNELKLKERKHIEYNMTLDHRLSSATSDDDESNGPDYISVSNAKPQVMVRLISGPAAEAFAEGSCDIGYAHIKVNSLNAILLLSSAESLGEFAEDEILMPTLPFKVELANCHIKLLDDKPRRYLSVPLPPPMEVNIDCLCVLRSLDGKISIEHKITDEASLPDRTLTGNFSNGDMRNEESSGADSFDGSGSLLHEKLNVIQDENDRLLEDMKIANARIVSLEEERNAILKVVEKLQQELMWSNNQNDKLADKLKQYKQYVRGLART
eukprot:gene17924-19706_t